MNGEVIENTVTRGGPTCAAVHGRTAVLVNRQLTAPGARAAAVRGDVDLIRIGHRLHVDAAHVDVLKPMRTSVRGLGASRSCRSTLLTVPLEMYQKESLAGTDTLSFAAGLEPAVRRLLEAAGHVVRVARYREHGNRFVKMTDPPPDVLPKPAAETLFRPYITDRPLIDCVRKHDRAAHPLRRQHGRPGLSGRADGQGLAYSDAPGSVGEPEYGSRPPSSAASSAA